MHTPIRPRNSVLGTRNFSLFTFFLSPGTLCALSQYPFVALVGRPNVGKSTLFNRIVGKRLAVVHDRPGTTRDRLHADAEWRGLAFTLIDTGGIEVTRQALAGRLDPLAEDSAQFLREIRTQAEVAIEDADVIVMV